jgi:hypothetical protein
VSEKVDRLIEGLVELDLDPSMLRDDPCGERWLSAELRELVDGDPECAMELAEFVEMELALADVHEPSDAFFTREVMDRLPEIAAVDDRRRTWILASAYALAIGVAYLLLGPLLSSGELAGWLDSVHAFTEHQAIEAGGMWMAAGLIAAAGALCLLPTGSRRQADA